MSLGWKTSWGWCRVSLSTSRAPAEPSCSGPHEGPQVVRVPDCCCVFCPRSALLQDQLCLGRCYEADGLLYSRMLPFNGTLYICESASWSLGSPWYEYRPKKEYVVRRGLKAAAKYLHIRTIQENTGMSACRDGGWPPSSASCIEPAKYEVFQVWKADRGITVMLCVSRPAQQLTEEPKEMSPSGDDHKKRYH